MSNQTYKTYKPSNISDKERFLNEQSILYDINELQHQLIEKQMELIANKINPDDYIGKWYKYTINSYNIMFAHIKDLMVTHDGLSIKIHLTLSEPAIDVIMVNDDVKVVKETTNMWPTATCFFDKKHFSLVKDLDEIPKLD